MTNDTQELTRRGWTNRERQAVPVRLLKAQAMRLRALAEERDVSQAQLIREAVNKLLDEAGC